MLFGIRGIYGGGLLAYDFGFLDGEFFVCFYPDFARFLESFLVDERSHLLQFIGHLDFSWYVTKVLMW